VIFANVKYMFTKNINIQQIKESIKHCLTGFWFPT